MDTNHTATETPKTAEKMINDTTKEMMEVYNKQLNLTTGFYNNFFNSVMSNSKSWNGSKGFSDSFLNSDLMKLFPIPFSGMGSSFSNPLLPSFDKLYKQLLEYNSNMFSTLSNGIKSTTDWSAISKGYTETVENRLEVFKKILTAMSETYNKQLDFSIGNTKKMMEEINNQFNTIINQNQKLQEDVLATYQVPFDEEEKKIKESNLNESKKRSNVSVVA